MNKQLLTMTIGMLCGASAFAQVEFVDAEGKVIPNGSTVIRNEIEKPVPVLEMYQINSGISVQNTSSAAVSVQSQINTTDLPFGQVALCFPGECWVNIGNFIGKDEYAYPTHKPTQSNLSADGPWTSAAATIAAGSTSSLQSEWKLNSLGLSSFNKDTDKGSVTVTYSLLVGGNAVTTIKVIYTTDQNAATGISDAAANAATTVGYYNAAGQKCTSASNGITIVKYSDGSTRKVINK